MKNDRVVNIRPFNIELHSIEDKGFQLWIYSNIGGDYTRRTITKIHFERWWLSHIAELLWKVIKRDQRILQADISALKGGE